MSSTRNAYAAGFFDGEGYVGLQRARRPECLGFTYSLRIQIGQDDERPLLYLASLWSGKVTIRPTPRIRRVHYQWCLFGPSAGQFLADIEPFLIVKRAQANLAIKFQASRKTGWAAGGRCGLSDEYRAYCEMTYRSIKNLNQMASKHPDYADAAEEAA